jgi:excisionase family DNA binding protein
VTVTVEELVELIAERAAEIVLAEQQPVEPEPWIGVQKAAEHLDCERHRLYDLVRRQKVRHRKDGARLLFRRSDLDSYLDGR